MHRQGEIDRSCESVVREVGVRPKRGLDTGDVLELHRADPSHRTPGRRARMRTMLVSMLTTFTGGGARLRA